MWLCRNERVTLGSTRLCRERERWIVETVYRLQEVNWATIENLYSLLRLVDLLDQS